MGAVDGDGVGVGEPIELAEVVVHRLVFVGEHGQGPSQGHAGDDPDGAVEDPGLAFVVVAAQLGDLIPDAEHPPAVPLLRRPGPLRGQCLLQQGGEVARSGGAAVRRRQHLDVADRVEPEFGGDAAGDDVHDEFGGFLRRVQPGSPQGLAAEPVEVGKPVRWGLAVVDAVGVDDDAGLLGPAEDLGQAHPRDGAWRRARPAGFRRRPRGAGRRRRPAADALRAGWPDQLVGRDHVHHRGLSSTTTRSASRGLSRSYLGSPPGCSSSSRCTVDAGWLVSSPAAWRPAGGRDQHHGGLWAMARATMEPDGETLPAARPAGEHRDLAVSASLTASCCPGARSWPLWPASQPSALGQSTPRTRAAAQCREFSRPASAPASAHSAR